MQQYDIKGMSCAACSARVERAVTAVEGVTACSVNLLTNSMSVEGEVSAEVIISAVTAAGYSAKLKGGEKRAERGEVGVLLKRLIVSLAFLLALMYISMGAVMLGLPFFTDNALIIAIIEGVLALIVIIINGKFYTSGIKSLLHGSPNMDTLVCLGSGASYIYSVVITVLIAVNLSGGNGATASHYLHGLYFESSAMILALITVGKTLEAYAKGKTTSAIKALTELAPKTATVLLEGEEKVIPLSQLKVGDIFVVRAGGVMPADGKIIEGGGAIDESAITGESVPVDKTVGDKVYSATVNGSGYIVARATRVGEDSTLGEIIKMVEGANATKAPIAKLADKVSGVFVPVVMSIAVITTVIWLIIGAQIGVALSHGIAVLVISCPCALGLATPVAIMVGSGVGAKRGVLFKSAAALESAGRIEIVALDKTGTVTEGKPSVTDAVCFTAEKEELMALAYALEEKSEHPLGRAIASHCKDYGGKKAESFTVLPGQGVSGVVDGKQAYAGNLEFIKTVAEVPESVESACAAFAGEGKTPMLFSVEGKTLGIIAVADTVKSDSRLAVEKMKAAGLRVVMLTGDNERTARAVARQVGIEEIRASLLPADKERIISELKSEGKTAMVGDGINDAVALTASDLGVAIGAGAEVAVESADIVLVSGSLESAVAAIKLGRKTLKNIRENLFWAFFYNCLTIPVAAGAFSFIGLTISPMLGALAMSLSSFCVVMNALRLNLFREGENINTVSKKEQNKENKTMKITLKIEGMMCPHCEARVKSTLEGLEGVKSAEVSHKEGSAVVECEGVTRSELAAAVTAQGYKVLD